MKYRRIINKYRFLVSDVLPFELPIIFSNRLIGKYFQKIKLSFLFKTDGDVCFSWSDNSELTYAIMCLLCGKPIRNNEKDSTLKVKEFESIPLKYRINRSTGKQRTLAVVHPLNQLSMMVYFERYKELILFYCNKSDYSLRYPKKLASWRYIKDYSHYLSVLKSDSASTIEEFDYEYESQRSFFRYEKYSNVYKFYESEYYHSLEKKYRHLMQIDISKCFDSVYTHSITWAVFGKEYAKQNRNNKSFANFFDSMIQKCNRSETNGIVIGPEFSRIFSEIILQQVDINIMQRILSEHEDEDLHICRYVDDYFVFYNSETTATETKTIIIDELSKFGLFLNESKTKTIDAPIITNLSVGKYDIRHLLEMLAIIDKQLPTIDSDDLIISVKRILNDNGLKYSEIQNYLLSSLERKVLRIVAYVKEMIHTETVSKEDSSKINRLYYNIIKFLFFLISVCPLVNSVLTATRILVAIIDSVIYFSDSKISGTEYIMRTRLFDYVFSESKKFFNLFPVDEKYQIENSLLLILLPKLGLQYCLSEEFVIKHFCNPFKDSHKKDFFDISEYYFLIMVLRFYIGDSTKYNKVKGLMYEFSLNLISRDMKRPSSVQLLLLIDSLSCPFIDITKKRELLRAYRINGESILEGSEENDPCDKLIGEIMDKRVGFINWHNFKLEEELDLKRSQFVY